MDAGQNYGRLTGAKNMLAFKLPLEKSFIFLNFLR